MLAIKPPGLPDNPLFRLLLVNGLAGAALALVLFAGLILTNTARLRDLIASSSNPLLPAGLLLGGLIVTFASLAMGTAVMTMKSDDDDHHGGLGATAEALVPVRVRANRRNRP